MATRTTLVTQRSTAERVAEFGSVRREGLQEIARLWHTGYLPLHFREFAASRYGYQARSRQYQRRKRRRQGHARPMVWSGRMERDLQSAAQIIADPDSAEIRMASRARALNLHGPQFREELTAVAPEEADRFARTLDDYIGRHMAAPGPEAH